MRLEGLHILHAGLGTNQNRIWRFHHNQVTHSTKRDESPVGYGDIFMSIVAHDGSSDAISICVWHDMRWQCSPSPHIVPIEFS